MKAIDRLSTVYQYATGVSIDFAFSEVDWAFGDETDAALYHVVQESLVNSFRHGKATRVRVFLNRDKGDIVMAIKDNGTGAARYDEGIGLAGMRERVAGLGGCLETNSGRGGFEVVVKIPAEGSRV